MVIPFQTNSSSKSCAFPRGLHCGRQVSAGSFRLFFLTFRDRKSSSVGEGLSLVDKAAVEDDLTAGRRQLWLFEGITEGLYLSCSLPR